MTPQLSSTPGSRRRAMLARGILAMLAACTAAPRAPAPPPSPTTPVLLANPVIPYPAMLRSAIVEGEVVFDLVVDSAGRTGPGRSRVVKSTHDLFSAAVRQGFQEATWMPATHAGLPAGGIWRDTIQFVLVRPHSAPCEPPDAHRRQVCTDIGTTEQSWRSPGMPDSTRRRWRDSLAVGRARWRAAAPRAYRVEITVGCFCFGSLGPVRKIVDVRDGRIVRTRRVEAPRAKNVATMQFWAAWTIDSLFDAAELDLAQDTRYVEAFELDPRYGFPRRVHTNVHYVTDSWSRLDVRSFVPLR